ncbi:dynein axonemal intermediate chain 1-like isoform X2 [Macrobrachium nipponense]
MRFRMMAKLTKIMSPEAEEPAPTQPVATKPKPPKPPGTGKGLANIKRLRILCRVRSVLGREIAPRKKTAGQAVPTAITAKFEKKKSVYWRRYVKKPTEPKFSKLPVDQEQPRSDPIVEITLTADMRTTSNEIIYDTTTGRYQEVKNCMAVLDLLSLPSKVLHKDNPKLRKNGSSEDDGEEVEKDNITLLLEELYGDVMSSEDIAKIDTQPNPFNFSERVSQTPHGNLREKSIQTDQAPGTTFSQNIGVRDIYDAYQWDEHLAMLREKEKQRDKDKQNNELVPQLPLGTPGDAPPPALDSPRLGAVKQNPFENLPGLLEAAIVVERMLNQNLYDEVTQDFKYWDDGSDEFKPLEGSLLPLWRFTMENFRSFTVTEVCWSPTYPDLFAASYVAGGVNGQDEGNGLVCIFSLKSPNNPERVFPAPCGVTCVHFHPQHCNLVAAGWSDGSVVVYDAKSPYPRALQSNAVSGKHILPVTQVRWVVTEPSEDLRLFSVSLDGRVTKWQVSMGLVAADILVFDTLEEKSYSDRFTLTEDIPLEGHGTCLAFCPKDSNIMLVGVDTGAILQCHTSSPTHSLTRYPAHQAPVRDLAWNSYQNDVFLSCSSDWTIKIWLQLNMTPIIVLDVGGAIAGVSWATFSSTVVIAATEEGRVHVYDLYLCKAPLCTQNITKKRKIRMSCIGFNSFFPIVLVGGERGHLVTLKLSPNLRKVHKDPRDLEEATPKEIDKSAR